MARTEAGTAGRAGAVLPGRACGEERGALALAHAVEHAQAIWGVRLVAAYALGSLAHGGFSAHVSDVDLGLVLADPLRRNDAAAVKRLRAAVSSEPPLGDRLSVFWASSSTLEGRTTGGRFPPLDRLDLIDHGRLLSGRDVRAVICRPDARDLIVSGARFALEALSIPPVTAFLKDPAALAAAGARKLTKLVLYPARFLYTAATGRVGMNDAAVTYVCGRHEGALAELLRRALDWRYDPPRDDRPVVVCLREGLLPLYRLFLNDYRSRLSEYGEPALAHAYEKWRRRLA